MVCALFLYNVCMPAFVKTWLSPFCSPCSPSHTPEVPLQPHRPPEGPQHCEEKQVWVWCCSSTDSQTGVQVKAVCLPGCIPEVQKFLFHPGTGKKHTNTPIIFPPVATHLQFMFTLSAHVLLILTHLIVCPQLPSRSHSPDIPSSQMAADDGDDEPQASTPTSLQSTGGRAGSRSSRKGSSSDIAEVLDAFLRRSAKQEQEIQSRVKILNIAL